MSDNFLRKISHLRRSTPLYMLYAELGRYPLIITIKTRMINYWNQLIIGKQSKLAVQIYKLMLNLPNFESKWLQSIKNTLNEVGRIDIWNNQNNIQSSSLKMIIKQTLIDQNQQKWHSSLLDSNKGLNYSIYKDSVELEDYLIHLKKSDWLYLLKFRTGNHFFPCETGRWSNIELNARTCKLCSIPGVADEYHYLLQCTYFNQARSIYIKSYYYRSPTIHKFRELLISQSWNKLHKLCTFIKIIIKTVKQQ